MTSQSGRDMLAPLLLVRLPPLCNHPAMRITAGLAVGAAMAGLLAAWPQPAAAAPASHTAPAAAGWHATEVHVPSGGSSGILYGIACRGTSCVAGGSYFRKPAGELPMISAESAGRWGTATKIRLPANARPTVGSAVIASISCPAATSCVAVGNYLTATSLAGLITTGHATAWSAATAPTLPSGAAAVPDAYLTGVSCTSPGSCVAVGGYTNRGQNEEAMAVTQAGGHWRRAVAIKPPSNADANPAAHFSGVSCPKAGYCVAVGAFTTKALDEEVMVAAEVRGRWGRAVQVPMPANAAVEPVAELYSVSCTSTRDCVATGSYSDNQSRGYPLIETYSRGHWAAAGFTRLPSGAEHTNQFATLNGVSCTAHGCTAAGSYENAQGVAAAMVVVETDGRWGSAVQIKLPKGAASGTVQNATLFAIACRSTSACTAVGSYVGVADADATEAMAVTRS